MRIGFAVAIGCGAVQLIVGGDDVLDFRRQPRFLQYDAVDEQALVGNPRCKSTQVGQRSVGGNCLFQHCTGF
ncbi:hypothetical protein D3C84_1213740 [compost metagenome]